MKKFLSKLPVMISCLVVTAILAGLYIGLLARPVAYGWKYTYTESTTYGDETPDDDTDDHTLSTTTTVIVNNSKLATVKIYSEDCYKCSSQSQGEVMQFWYLKDGKDVILLEVREGTEGEEEAYNAIVEAYFEADEAGKLDLIESNNYMKIRVNAFRITGLSGITDSSLKCAGTVVYTVLMGIVLVAAVTFSTLSVIFFIKSKKHA